MKSSLLILSLLSTFCLAAQAAPNDGIVGLYARVEVGRSYLSLSGKLPQASADEQGSAIKVFGGYRFDESLGVEAGYAALGSFSETVNVSGANLTQNGKARSIFGAATCRLPVGESFALHGRLGLSSGKVSGTKLLPAGDTLIGSKTSVLVGLGAEYRPRPNLALTVNVDSYGKLSNKVNASALVFGVHFTL
jgi:OmpA-OmpF porin, OOP family